MRILLHICCGPCATFPVKALREEGHELAGFFYNPNIHPYKEFSHRLETLKEYAVKVNLSVHIDDRYSLEDFLQAALKNLGERCSMCYEVRLREAARFAKENGFDAFSTTLLVSPYQKHEVICQVAEQIAKEEGISFYYSDFRPGFREGVEISKAMELYRQPYCGCIFSEKERYCKEKKGNA
ncbi:MAG: epoxyqueuosine reductase QueH [Pelosinus sp.]|nr:epoxyqueuosine reductase QueH [Pelosinus sp.]